MMPIGAENHRGRNGEMTTRPRVGTAAIERFLRPVCYQDIPADLLPEPLRDGNPLGLWRRVDGALGRH